MIDLSKEKLELDYPCSWIYKVVVQKTHKVEQSIKEVVPHKQFNIKPSKQSTKGNYSSYSVELVVENEEDRISIYESLKIHKEIKMVI